MSDVPPDEAVPEVVQAFDAPLEQRDEWGAQQAGAPTIGAAVRGAGIAAVAGAGPRRARRAAETAAAPPGTRHSWTPVGPRNVGGRVRALVVDPTEPLTMYAGAAAGGVFKSVDGGASWFPLWHDEPSLAIGALAISPADHDVVWAATGEVRTGGGETIEGSGIWRTTDGGATWANPATPPVPGTDDLRGTRFDAIAAHPGDRDSCWAVGPAGIFRTLDGGTVWDHLRAGEYYSDVAFATSAAGAIVVWLVRAVNDDRSAVLVRITDPDRDVATLKATALPDIWPAGATAPVPLPASVVTRVTPAADAGPAPGRGKLAVATAPGVDAAFVRFVSGEAHLGIFRSTNAKADDLSKVRWRRLQDSPQLAAELQGTYNLVLRCTPDGASLVTGMIDLHLNRAALGDATTTNRWVKAMAWQLWAMHRGHHGDQHGALFAPVPGGGAGALALWCANDGGVSRSLDWATGAGHAAEPEVPPAQGTITWQKRSHGIVAVQMYDLTQSPLVPSLYGCGFQDNGIFVSGGGPTWQMLMGADGGYVAFDPDDPYRLLASWQGGIAEAHVPGLHRDLTMPPGSNPTSGSWPRVLVLGLSPADRAAFVAETVHHPRKGGRVLHARRNVLYGRTPGGGERWQPEPLGRSFELRHLTSAAVATLEVLPSPAAVRLGLVPQSNRAVRDGATAAARIRSVLDGPYRLQPGDVLRLRRDGAETVVTFAAGGLVADLGAASPAEVAAAVNAAAPGLAATVCWPSATTVTLVTRSLGTTSTIDLGGSAAPMLGVTSPARGDVGLPAMVVLDVSADLSGEDLTVAVDGGAPTAIDCDDLPDAARASAADVARLLVGRLPADVVVVGLRRLRWGVRFSSLAGGGDVRLTGTAVARLRLQPGATGPSVVAPAGPWMLQTDTGGSRRLTISDGTRTTDLDFTAAVVPDATTVTPTQLRAAVATHLAGLAAGSRPRVTVALESDVRRTADWSWSDEGEVTEITWSPTATDVVWAGDGSGALHRSEDDGARWLTIRAPELTDRDRGVEAIAVDPRDARRAIVGLAGRTSRADDPGFVFRTDDAGSHWRHVGAELVGGDGRLVGLNALEVDPERPDVVWAATDVGSFRSTDFGTSWQPFNEGLPNVIVRDLAFEPTTRTLRAGAWGRGVYDRHVGGRDPEDVRLLLRANTLDDGSRPPLRGLDPMLVPPGGATSASPDIKVTRQVPVGVGDLIDGVELDEDIDHEPPTPGEATVLVQVHNRGPFPATDVRVTLLWAPVTASGPPPLPPSLFAARAAGPMVAGASHPPWLVLGDGAIPSDGRGHDVVAPAQPRVHRVPTTWPVALAGHRAIALLAIVSSPEDPFDVAEPDVDELVALDPKVGIRITPVLRPEEDQAVVLRSTTGVPFQLLAPGPGATAAADLGLPISGPPRTVAVSRTATSFALGGTPPRGFVIRVEHQAAVDLGPTPDVADLTAAAAVEVRDVLTRDTWSQRLPLWGFTIGRRVGIQAGGAARFALTGGSGAARLGLATAATMLTRLDGTALDPFDLSTGGPHALDLTVRTDVRVLFDAVPEVPAPATAAPHQVRAAINRLLRHTGIPVVAEPAHVELAVRRSAGDQGHEAVLGGGHHADLVVAPAPVADGAERRALFDLPTVLGADRLRPSTENVLYLRSANLGNVEVAAVRHRLWRIDVAAAGPHAATLVVTGTATALPAGGSAVVELRWDPGALVAGGRVVVLAVADVVPDLALEPPAAFASLDDLDTFCALHPNAALRELEVG